MDERTPLIRSSGRLGEDPETLPEAKVETRSGVDMVFFAIAILGSTPPMYHADVRTTWLI
jgi:hypothetical protein